MTLRNTLITILAFSMLLAGCNRDEPEPPPLPDPPATDASPSPTPESSPTQAAPDPTRVPDDPADIDEAYVQAVLDALHEPLGEALRIAIQGAPFEEGALPVELSRAISEIYTAEWQDGVRNARAEEFSEPRWSDEVQPALKSPDDWQPVRYTVEAVEVVRADCIVVVTEGDFSPSLRSPPEANPRVGFVLRLRPDSDTRSSLNPTPWRMDANNVLEESESWGEEQCE